MFSEHATRCRSPPSGGREAPSDKRNFCRFVQLLVMLMGEGREGGLVFRRGACVFIRESFGLRLRQASCRHLLSLVPVPGRAVGQAATSG